MRVLELVGHVRFALLILVGIAAIGYVLLLPERVCETGGIYVDVPAPPEE